MTSRATGTKDASDCGWILPGGCEISKWLFDSSARRGSYDYECACGWLPWGNRPALDYAANCVQYRDSRGRLMQAAARARNVGHRQWHLQIHKTCSR
ncbi:hypothetical protein MRX96_005273 [Rhipicephalus microplus]